MLGEDTDTSMLDIRVFEESPAPPIQASLMSSIASLLPSWRRGRPHPPRPSPLQASGRDTDPTPSGPTLPDTGMHGAHAGVPMQSPLPRPSRYQGPAPPPPPPRVEGMATQAPVPPTPPTPPPPLPPHTHGPEDKSGTAISPPMPSLGMARPSPPSSVPHPLPPLTASPPQALMQHLGSLGTGEGGQAIVRGSGPMPAPPPLGPTQGMVAGGGAFAPPPPASTSGVPHGGPPPTLVHTAPPANSRPTPPPQLPAPMDLRPPPVQPLPVALTATVPCAPLDSSTQHHPASKRLATLPHPPPHMGQNTPPSEQGTGVQPTSLLPVGWVQPPPPPLPPSPPSPQAPMSADAASPSSIMPRHVDIGHGSPQQVAQGTHPVSASVSSATVPPPPPPPPQAPPALAVQPPAPVVAASSAVRADASRVSDSSASPVSSVRQAQAFLKSRLTNGQLPSDTRLLETVLLAMTTNTGGLEGNGLSDGGSFDAHMAHLFKQIADLGPSGQDCVGSSAATGSVEHWAAGIYHILATPRLTVGTRKKVMVATGDELMEAGRVKVAHALYLVAGLEPGHKAARERNFRLVGVNIEGQELLPEAFRDPAYVAALQDTEILDQLRHPVRDPQAPDHTPDNMTISLLRFKLVYITYLLDQGNVESAMAYLRSMHDMVWPWVKRADQSSSGRFSIIAGGPYSIDLLTSYATLADRWQKMRFVGSAPPPPPPPPRAPVVAPPPLAAPRGPPPSSSTQRPLPASSSEAPAALRAAPSTPPPNTPGPKNVWNPATATPPPCPSVSASGTLDLSRSSGLTGEGTYSMNVSSGQAPVMAGTQMQVTAVDRCPQPAPNARANTEGEGFLRRSVGYMGSWFGLGGRPSSPVKSSTTVRGATYQTGAAFASQFESSIRSDMPACPGAMTEPPRQQLAAPPTSGVPIRSYYAAACPEGYSGRRIATAYAYSAHSTASRHASPPPSNVGPSRGYAINGSSAARPVNNI